MSSCNDCDCPDIGLFGDNVVNTGSGLATVNPSTSEGCSWVFHVAEEVYLQPGVTPTPADANIFFTTTVIGNVQYTSGKYNFCTHVGQLSYERGCPSCDGEIIYCKDGEVFKTSLAKLKGYSLL